MKLAWLLAFAVGAYGQDAIRYPPLAKQARISGVVVISGGKAVSGHPLLVPAAVASLPLLNLNPPDAKVVFHFVLQDSGGPPKSITVKRGDAFDRFFLRLLHRKTERAEFVCVSEDLPTKVDSAKTPIEVWVYAGTPCVNTLRTGS